MLTHDSAMRNAQCMLTETPHIGTAEVAAMLDLDKATVTRLAATGALGPVIRLGEKKNSPLVFLRAEVERYKTQDR